MLCYYDQDLLRRKVITGKEGRQSFGGNTRLDPKAPQRKQRSPFGSPELSQARHELLSSARWNFDPSLSYRMIFPQVPSPQLIFGPFAPV